MIINKYLIIILLLLIISNYEFINNSIKHSNDLVISYIGANFLNINRCKKYKGDLDICKVVNHKYIINTKDTIISASLKLGMYWEEFLHKYFKMYKNKKLNCLDIGANIGTHSIYLSSLFNNVYAFEPQRRIFKILKLNKKLNKCNNLKLFNNGLGEGEYTIKMQCYDKNKKKNMGGIGIVEKNGCEKINVKKLDSYKFKDIGLIKIDVEGYELNVFKGGIKTLKKWKPIILFEEHNINSKVFKFLRSLNYEIRKLSIANDYIAIQKKYIQ